MSRAIQLGASALGNAAPNPMVGCVLVYKDRIIGEGYTSPYGGAHAEVNAIASVKERELLPKATLYVTLEPCAHFGKTPPCTDLIIKNAIPEVVIGLVDPHHKVAGKGIEQLKSKGCRVITGVLEQACREHHKRFLCLHEHKRPYIILKWAQSTDGFLAPAEQKRNSDPQPFWISNKYAQQLVHQWRSQEQAILVGSKTVKADNPRLNTRLWKGRSPIRVVIDKDLEIHGSYHILDGSEKTIIFTAIADRLQYKEHISYELVDFAEPLARQICERLAGLGVMSLIVEGGLQTLNTFLEANLWDEARIFTGSACFGDGLKAPLISGQEQPPLQIGDNSLRILRHG